MFRKILWILPFLFFCLGYFIPFYLLRSQSFVVPSLVYLPLDQAIKKASSIGCGLQIIQEREDATQQAGTVIYQSPTPGSTIKSHQSIHVVITKVPEYLKMISLQGLSAHEVQAFCTKNALTHKAYFLESIYPFKSCLAHVPRQEEPLMQNSLIAYYSAGQTSMRILPSLKGKTYQEARDFLESYGIVLQIVEQKFALPNARIDSQKPLAGSLIDIKKPLTVYIKIKDPE